MRNGKGEVRGCPPSKVNGGTSTIFVPLRQGGRVQRAEGVDNILHLSPFPILISHLSFPISPFSFLLSLL